MNLDNQTEKIKDGELRILEIWEIVLRIFILHRREILNIQNYTIEQCYVLSTDCFDDRWEEGSENNRGNQKDRKQPNTCLLLKNGLKQYFNL